MNMCGPCVPALRQTPRLRVYRVYLKLSLDAVQYSTRTCASLATNTTEAIVIFKKSEF